MQMVGMQIIISTCKAPFLYRDHLCKGETQREARACPSLDTWTEKKRWSDREMRAGHSEGRRRASSVAAVFSGKKHRLSGGHSL